MTKRTHRCRSFAPSLNPLEGRVLLSMTATKVVLVPSPNYKHGHDLTSVGLEAEVEPVTGTGTPTGTVTFEMVMQPGMKMMKGMKPGTTIFGTEPLSGGVATLTLPAKMVLKMPLEIIYSGDSNFASSTDSPATLTKSGLMGSAMKMGSGMSGMKM